MGLITSNQITKTNFSANGQTLELDVAAVDSVRFEFSGTYAFTGAFEATVDGTNWHPFLASRPDTAATSLNHSTANATQAYEANCRSVAKVRLRLTAFTSAGAHKVLISGSK